MSQLDYKKIAQPYSADVAEFIDVLFPVRTTAELAAAAGPINTIDKRAGKFVWDSTLGQPVYADGPDPTDTWSLGSGVVSTTPS